MMFLKSGKLPSVDGGGASLMVSVEITVTHPKWVPAMAAVTRLLCVAVLPSER